MGKVRTDMVKRVSNKIINNFPDRLTPDFDQNKRILKEELGIQIKTKRLRNRVAGYISHVVRIRGDDSIVVEE